MGSAEGLLPRIGLAVIGLVSVSIRTGEEDNMLRKLGPSDETKGTGNVLEEEVEAEEKEAEASCCWGSF